MSNKPPIRLDYKTPQEPLEQGATVVTYIIMAIGIIFVVFIWIILPAIGRL